MNVLAVVRDSRRGRPGNQASTPGRRVLRELAIAALIVIAVMVWVGPSLYRQDLVFLAATYGLVALGMYIPFVLGASLSVAYGAYAAIGAYAVAIVATQTQWSMWWGWLIGAIVSAAVALVLGLATQRLSGFYLVAVTLLFSLAFTYWITDARWITGGASGITGLPPLSLFDWEPSRYVLTAAAAGFVCLVTIVVDRMRNSVWGVTLRVSSESPLAVRTAGIKPTHLRLVALAIGAAIGSLAGSVFVTSVQAVTPETLTLNVVFLAIFMPIIGGRFTAWGAPLGAVVVVAVTLNMPGYQGSGELILAVAVLIIIMLAPSGLLGYLRWGWNKLLDRLSKRSTDGSTEKVLIDD